MLMDIGYKRGAWERTTSDLLKVPSSIPIMAGMSIKLHF